MPRSREHAWEYLPEPDAPLVGHGLTRAASPIEALMQAGPSTSIGDSIQELLPLREAIQDAIDSLEERERYVFDALVVERVSQRRLACRLGVSRAMVVKIRNAALRKLRERLETNPLIMEHLEVQ